METIAISKFKATCLGLLERVRQTGEPVLITRRGRPIAQVIPPPPPKASPESAFGCMADASEQLGDIISPISTDDWEVLK